MKPLNTGSIVAMMLAVKMQYTIRDHISDIHMPSRHPSEVYTGRSHTSKANLRKVQKHQRYRAHCKLQRKSK